MAERLRKIKEEPIIDERLPHPYREVVKELRAIRTKLEEISEKFPIAVPAVPAIPPVAVPPPRVIALPKIPVAPVEWRPMTDRLDLNLTELRAVNEKLNRLLFRASGYHVETLDLGTARTDMEFEALQGFALTVFRCGGTIGIKFNAKSEDKISIDALTYPQTLLIDWFDFTKVYVTNTAQSGLSATLISWKC